MSRACIICRLEKAETEFNQEHILLATIGGSFEIDTVCKSCNSNLSQNFNVPFLNESVIGIYRSMFKLERIGIKGQKRKIANPVKKVKPQGENADSYYFVVNNGQVEVRQKPEVKILKTEHGPFISIKASKEEIEKVKEEVLKKHKIDESQIGEPIITTEKTPEQTATIHINYKPIIFECVKVAYQFTVTVIPDYYKDEWAIQISNFLKGGELSLALKDRLDAIHLHKELMKNEYEILKPVPVDHHIIALKQYEKLGLVCYVKMFNIIYPVHVSDKIYITNDNAEISLVNNAPSRYHYFNLSLSWKTIKIVVSNLNGLAREKFIPNLQDDIAIYNEKGELISFSIQKELPSVFPMAERKMDFKSKKINYDLSFEKTTYYVKNNVDGKMHPLQRVIIEYDIVY